MLACNDSALCRSSSDWDSTRANAWKDSLPTTLSVAGGFWKKDGHTRPRTAKQKWLWRVCVYICIALIPPTSSLSLADAAYTRYRVWSAIITSQRLRSIEIIDGGNQASSEASHHHCASKRSCALACQRLCAMCLSLSFLVFVTFFKSGGRHSK